MAAQWKRITPEGDYKYHYAIRHDGMVARVKKDGKAVPLPIVTAADYSECVVLELVDPEGGPFGDGEHAWRVKELMAQFWEPAKPKPKKVVPQALTDAASAKSAPKSAKKAKGKKRGPKPGTLRGTRNKITADDVRAIRKAAAKGTSQGVLAEKYHITTMAVSLIVRRINWKHVEDAE